MMIYLRKRKALIARIIAFLRWYITMNIIRMTTHLRKATMARRTAATRRRVSKL